MDVFNEDWREDQAEFLQLEVGEGLSDSCPEPVTARPPDTDEKPITDTEVESDSSRGHHHISKITLNPGKSQDSLLF